jgi:hypothetical protein
MKVILNEYIKDLRGNFVHSRTGRVLPKNGVEEPEVIKTTYGAIALQNILQMRTKTDEDAAAALALASKIQDSLEVATPMTIEVSAAEFAVIKAVIDNQPVLIKAQFLAMVQALNAEEIRS